MYLFYVHMQWNYDKTTDSTFQGIFYHPLPSGAEVIDARNRVESVASSHDDYCVTSIQCLSSFTHVVFPNCTTSSRKLRCLLHFLATWKKRKEMSWESQRRKKRKNSPEKKEKGMRGQKKSFDRGCDKETKNPDFSSSSRCIDCDANYHVE